MDGIVSRGLGITLALTFLAVALLVWGQLGTGSNSFWYGINNPNTTGATGSANLLQATVFPILVTLGAAVAVILGTMNAVRGK